MRVAVHNQGLSANSELWNVGSQVGGISTSLGRCGGLEAKGKIQRRKDACYETESACNKDYKPAEGVAGCTGSRASGRAGCARHPIGSGRGGVRQVTLPGFGALWDRFPEAGFRGADSNDSLAAAA